MRGGFITEYLYSTVALSIALLVCIVHFGSIGDHSGGRVTQEGAEIDTARLRPIQ